MFPIKKTYTNKILDELGNEVAVVKYDQATVYERYKFMNSKNQSRDLACIVQDNIQYSQKVSKKEKDRILQSLISIEFIEELTKTRYKVYDSIFESKAGRKAIEQSNIVFICKELGLTPHDLLHNYTMEEFQYYLDGIVYNYNEQSKEGQQKNDMSRMKKDPEEKKKMDKLKAEADFLDGLDKI